MRKFELRFQANGQPCGGTKITQVAYTIEDTEFEPIFEQVRTARRPEKEKAFQEWFKQRDPYMAWHFSLGELVSIKEVTTD